MPATRMSLKKSAVDRGNTKSSGSTNETNIKFVDKSRGQLQLAPIFDEIKGLLTPYKKGTMQLISSPGQVALISKKAVEIIGRKRDELCFASARVQKGYVGFYYMPVYGDAKMKEMIKPQLLKCLKGKACFHIRTYDNEVFSQIKEALNIGYVVWQKRGWIG